MEELTKTQIVLLTLLVSFVTSIATGIVTVALVDQSSEGVGQTIQTVVERTIETVIPGTKATSTDEIARKVPVSSPAPSESDMIVQAVANNSPSLIRIRKTNSYPDNAFVALGLIISKNGQMITDSGLLADVNAKYVGVFPDGKEATITASSTHTPSSDIAVFTVSATPGETFHPAILGDSDKLALGQKVISLAGGDKDVVGSGQISSFDTGEDKKTTIFIHTDFDTKSKAYGSILMNLQGQVIGIKTAGATGADADYRSINSVKNEI